MSFKMRAMVCAMLLCASGLSKALAPQTGIYWNPEHPGVAMYVENQNGTVFAVLYGYSNDDSEPEFYVASGPLLPSVDADFLPRDGLYPIQGFGSPIYRVPSGPCLACVFTPIPAAEHVGSLQISFPNRASLRAKIFFSDGRVWPTPEDQIGEFMRRFDFAVSVTPTAPPSVKTYFIDMRGEWVFVDQSDPVRVPWRFHFTTREEGVDLSDFPLRASVAFRDVTRNAVLYCFSPEVTGLTTAERQALPNIGCEVRQNGAALFWSENEIVTDEFFGSIGAMPPRSAGIFRGSQRVVGRRISD